MKRKIYFVLLGLLVSFSFIDSVFAEDEFTFSMGSSVISTTTAKGEEFYFDVFLKSDSEIAQCSFELDADSNLEFVSKNGSNSWNFTEGTDTLVIKNNSSSSMDLSSGKNIFRVTYKINGAGKVKIDNIECTSKTDDGSTGTVAEHESFEVEFNVDETVDLTTLKELKVTGGKMSPSFSSDVTSYQIELDSPNFSLTMTANNPDYQDKIVVTDEDGNELDPSNLTFSNKGGQALMKINVTVNEKTTYKLVASYVESELNNELASLKINGVEIKLVSGKYNYQIEVENDVTQLVVEATLKDSENFKFKEGPGTYAVNSFAIVVEPKSDEMGAEEASYLIDVVKKGSNKPSSGTDEDGNVTQNQQTSDIPMVVMAIVLISSFVGSLVLYRKNLESYK